MTKSKRRKSSRKEVIARPIALTLSKTDLIVIERLNINAFIPYLGWISAAYLLYDGLFNDAKIVTAAGWTFYLCSFVAPVFMLIGVRLSNLAKEERQKPRNDVFAVPGGESLKPFID